MVTRVIYLLFTLGGFSALIYEVMWMRSFSLVFGSSTRSASAVLAAYFGGMALGSLIGAKLARGGRPVVRYGWAEIGVGLSALLVTPWLMAYDAIYPLLYDWSAGHAWLLTLGKLLLALVALGPPTICMGITLPLLARAVVTHPDHVARRTGLLYALNVLGATAGAVIAGFFLPPLVGVQASIYLAVCINLLIGLVALQLRKGIEPRLVSDAEPSAPEQAERATAWPASVLIVAAAISGFGTLALEVYFTRLLSQRSEGSVYSFTLMLAIFLVFLGAGAAFVARCLDRWNPWRFLAWTQTLAVAALLLSPLVFAIIPVLTLFSDSDTLATRLLKLGIGSVVALGPAVFLIGVVLPTTWKIAGQGISSIGSQVGILTAWNTLAALGGALVAGFLCLPMLGLGRSIVTVACLYAILAVVGFFRGYQGIVRWAGCTACLAIVTGWYVLGAWRVEGQPLDEAEKLLSYHDGEAATVAVTEDRAGQRKLKMNHDYLLGSTTAALREVRQGRLPLVLHPKPGRVALIGVATGMTASAVLDFPVEHVVAMELVPGVVDVLGLFSRWNRSFFDDRRVNLVVADGRNHLLGTRDRFDVIISDLFVPWHAGTGNLYTVEHFKTVARRLAPGGIFAQWLPAYQLNLEEMRTITASLLDVFPAVTLWRNDFHPDQPLLALLAYRDGTAIDAVAVRAHCARLAHVDQPPAPWLSSPAGVAMLYVCGDSELRDWTRGAPRNTDDRPCIEYGTPKSLFRHRQTGTYPIHEFLARFRPRAWCYAEPLAPDRSNDEVFRAADLVHDASMARSRNNFELEYQCVKELGERTNNVRAVSDLVVSVADRYRRRHMRARSEQLLAVLVDNPRPPIPALVGLAEARRFDGKEAEAIALLERAVEQAPQVASLRRRLADLLESCRRYARAEVHLRRLVESNPNDHRLRLDLAHVLDKQGKTADAGQQIEQFRKRWDGKDRKEIWAYLRCLGLGSYVDRAAPAP